MAMKITARNVLKGKVKRVVHGLVTSEITLELPVRAEIVSTIAKSAAEHLRLLEGQEVSLFIEGSDIMIALD
jgi:molybdopterin-binding protein